MIPFMHVLILRLYENGRSWSFDILAALCIESCSECDNSSTIAMNFLCMMLLHNAVVEAVRTQNVETVQMHEDSGLLAAAIGDGLHRHNTNISRSKGAFKIRTVVGASYY